MTFDILIENGLLVDGTGAAGQPADVGICRDRIAAIGDLDAAPARRRLDATGSVVAPGFVDIYTHSDGEFLRELKEVPKATHVAPLVGHGAIRACAMGFVNRTPTPDELADMRSYAAEAMEAGAFGISTGLVYPPGVCCEAEELIEVSRVVASSGGIYASAARFGDPTLRARILREMVNFVMADEDVEFLLPQPESIIGSDGWSTTPGGPTGGGHPHPRCYGTFPRVLARYVRETRLLSLEQAVHKMTGKPARKLRLDRRGELREGNFADVVVFDPTTIRDRATFEDPHQYADGVHWVIVDGHLTLDRGVLSERLVGQVLAPAL